MSSEYGWGDEAIWNLPVCRFRQITATIQQRRYHAARAENGRFSWLGRTLATFIAGGYMVEKKGQNPALERAGQLAFDDVEAALLGAPLDKPVVSAKDNQPIDPDEAVARALARNSNGSFERFMGMTSALDTRGRMI